MANSLNCYTPFRIEHVFSVLIRTQKLKRNGGSQILEVATEINPYH